MLATDKAIASRATANQLREAMERSQVAAATATAAAVFAQSTAAAAKAAAAQAESMQAQQAELVEGELITPDQQPEEPAPKPNTKSATTFQEPPQELKCSNYLIGDKEGLGTVITFGPYYRRDKEYRRGGETIAGATCCERNVSVDMLDFSTANSFVCPTCILPLKRRGIRGTGTLSASAQAAAAATAAYMAGIPQTTNNPRAGVYSPWREFSDRVCAMTGCDKPGDKSTPVTLFSRDVADDGLFNFIDGYFCNSCADMVSIALRRDFYAGTLQGALVSRDFLSRLAAGSNIGVSRSTKRQQHAFAIGPPPPLPVVNGPA
jgi:hypothetical protein